MTEEERLRTALEDALEGLQEMLPYVESYFVHKWKLADYVERAEAALNDGPDPEVSL